MKPIQLDLEKLFLLCVSKENLDVIGKTEKHIPYKNIDIYAHIEVVVKLFGSVFPL